MEDLEKHNMQNDETKKESGLMSESMGTLQKNNESTIDDQAHSGQQDAILSQVMSQDSFCQVKNTVTYDLVCRNVAVDELSYSERLDLVSGILEYLNSVSRPITDLLADTNFLSFFPVMKQYRQEGIIDICKSASFSKDQQNNVALAGIIFYILTRGKYPQDVWDNSIKAYDKTELGNFWLRGKEFVEITRKTIGDRQATEILDIVKKTRREQEKRDIDIIISDCHGVGAVKIFEMLWEVFITKYGNYDAKLWSRKILEFRKKIYQNRCEYKESNSSVEIYAVSCEGRLDKPMHNGCEDCSFVSVYDESTWLAIVADGVGSCINSALGSETATIVLAETILSYLREKEFIGAKKRFIPKHITDNDWAELMYFFKDRLSEEFYDGWEYSIKHSKDYLKANCSDMSGFSTTLQFAFGCRKFVACGRLGDGGFYVRKREQIGKEMLFGGLSLDDGISGVTRHEVFTVPNLKTNPHAMVIDFFNNEEVSDIILTSDGVVGAMGDTIKQTDSFVGELSVIPFDQRCRELLNIANICSDCNETHYGSGDDSSIAFIHFNHTK